MRIKHWQLLLVLAGLACGSSVRAGEWLRKNGAFPEPGTTPLERIEAWFTPAPKPAKKTPEAAKNQQPTNQEAVQPQPSKADQAAAQRAREEALLLQRLATCDKFQQIAIETNDEALLRQASQLSERAYAIYREHVAHLGSGRNESTASNTMTDWDRPAPREEP